MRLEDVINKEWLDTEKLRNAYVHDNPFPSIIMENFLESKLLRKVVSEFPDLSKLDENEVIRFNNSREIKFAGKGMRVLSPAAIELNSYLQSDLFMGWLNAVSGIEEPLIADPYLAGGGYHEIKRGGLLKIHADFNKHPKLDLDRRLNLIIYLNEDWDPSWGGGLQLFDENMDEPVKTVVPNFNTAILFSTTSFTFHGHPDPITCPENRSRRSLAYYYFSTGRPESEKSAEKHSTLFKERLGESFNTSLNLKSVIKDFMPPIMVKLYRKVSRKL
jgi:Rps23 Pro-64 3,4-dihydroxylase Tpa1-like proline 4-hydroxylase